MKKWITGMAGIVLALCLGMQVHAVEFTVTDVAKTMYTVDNTQVFVQPDATLPPAAIVQGGLSVQVTGITSNGWYQVTSDRIYYIPGNSLTDTTAAPIVAQPKTYQAEISAKVGNADEALPIIQKALSTHVNTVHMTSESDVFGLIVNTLQDRLGAEVEAYEAHNAKAYHIRRTGNDYTLEITWLSTIEEEQALDAYVQQSALQYTGSTYDKIKGVHDFICNHTEYCKETQVRAADNRSAYDAVANGKAVCTGYALLFQKYMDTLGIPCYSATGIRNGGPHMWNIVNVDGQWYHIDCTWDDQVSYISRNWFLRGAAGAGYSQWGGIPLAATDYPR